MPVRRLLLVTLVSLFSALFVACGSSGEIPEADSVDSLGKALAAAGLSVNGPNDNDFLSSSFFSVPGVQFRAGGETVFAYEFDDPDELVSQRSLVSPDGYGIGSKYIQWAVAPHYYQNGSMIVIYDGDKRLVMDTLAAAMGERFAGSDPV